jgi:hypothetical protein
MAKVAQSDGVLSVAAYPGDAKMLLAFDLKTEAARRNLAGFTIQVTPPGSAPYYLWNNLSFEAPADHAQLAGEPPYSTANAPIHKFRWVHVPGLDHQGLNPPFGDYTYTVTPRYFDAHQHMLPLDPARSVSVTAPLQPFSKGSLKLGFTRGFVQSQAFVRHFGPQLPTRPKGQPINYDTSQVAGTNPRGETYTYAEQYRWLGFTARDRVFELLEAVDAAAGASIDIFAYDLNEPDILHLLLKLGGAGKARIILDNADLHHDPSDPTPEDQFADMFTSQAGATKLLRGRFGRYAHDKIFIVYQDGLPQRVLTGSTNFSVTGLYVNSNHVIVFEDPGVAKLYADLFQEVWTDRASKSAFAQSAFAGQAYAFAASADLPSFDVTFSPHPKAFAATRLQEIVDRCQAEANDKGNIFFAVMELSSNAPNPVYDALTQLHVDPNLFSYGISDDPSGISFYPVGGLNGVLVTGKPSNTDLPPPFNQVPGVGAGHQIHHKFVVCGFGGADPIVYCGSSNLALTGEQVNGDNLLCIRDDDVATAFTIEALLLIDHFNFLDSTARGPKGKGDAAHDAPPPADKRAAAASAGWHLGTTDAWVAKYFDPDDLHCRDRAMFA